MKIKYQIKNTSQIKSATRLPQQKNKVSAAGTFRTPVYLGRRKNSLISESSPVRQAVESLVRRV